MTQYADNHGIRSWTYYALAALIIGVGAYWLADAFNVTPEHTQANAIGTLAFAAAALAYATTFWLFSGRYAGRDRAYIIPEPVATRDMKFKVEATKTS